MAILNGIYWAAMQVHFSVASKHSETFTRLTGISVNFLFQVHSFSRYHTDAINSFTSFLSLGKFAKKKERKIETVADDRLFIKRGNSTKFLVRGNYSPLSSREITMSATPFAYVRYAPHHLVENIANHAATLLTQVLGAFVPF